MATFEKRKNVEGKVTAIRVKIRRVGLPHISQSFPVQGDSQTALRKAEKAAKDWADEISKNFDLRHGNFKTEQPSNNRLASSRLSNIWAKANNPPTLQSPLPFQRIISQAEGDQLIMQANTSEAKILTALLLDCGLTMEEISMLRWQHLRFSRQQIEVSGLSGLTTRYAPLTPLTVEMLLAANQRKYGKLFGKSADALFKQLPKSLTSKLGQYLNLRFQLNCKQEVAHRMADKGFSSNDIYAYLGLYEANTQPESPNHAPLTQLPTGQRNLV